jgi:periplasmic protein TonB
VLPPETPPGLTRPAAAPSPPAAAAVAAAPASTSATRPPAAAQTSAANVPSSAAQPSSTSQSSSGSSAARRAPSGEPPPVVREARLIHRVEPDYPSAAKRDGVQGSVDLEVTVSARGVVEDVSVVKATPPDVFDKSAVAAVRKWKYDPRFVDGLASEAHLTVHLEFVPGR